MIFTLPTEIASAQALVCGQQVQAGLAAAVSTRPRSQPGQAPSCLVHRAAAPLPVICCPSAQASKRAPSRAQPSPQAWVPAPQHQSWGQNHLGCEKVPELPAVDFFPLSGILTLEIHPSLLPFG